MKTQEEIEQLAQITYPKDNELDEYCGFIKGYTQCQEDNSTSKVTRVEVVDETGRVYTKWNCSIELSYQDDGRTLKVFIKPLNKQDNEN